MNDDERKALTKAREVLATLTPETSRSDSDVFTIKRAAGIAHDAGKTQAAIVLNALQVEMDTRAVSDAAIDQARSVVERWTSELR